MESEAKKKAKIMYDTIDGSHGFYSNHVKKEYRSTKNVPFFIQKNNETLVTEFVNEGEKKGLYFLKGHPALGGCRVSFYNGNSVESVEKVRDHMIEFMEKHEHK